MAQAYPLKRCGHCGMPLVQTTTPGGEHGSLASRCADCDQSDPLKLPANKAWIEGELRATKVKQGVLSYDGLSLVRC
jgi:hypothetical protein